LQFFCKFFYFQKIGDLPFLGIGHNFFVAIGVGIGGEAGRLQKFITKKITPILNAIVFQLFLRK
jgi:hypothetical protein